MLSKTTANSELLLHSYQIINGHRYSFAVDWWSYGVLCYEMITGQVCALEIKFLVVLELRSNAVSLSSVIKQKMILV